jgi:EAL domain-containing protein (putative c-di-GMP-specific phosphodiesterase class I)
MPFSVMMISFRTLSEASTENRLLRKTIEMLSEFLFSIDTARVFDTAEGYFLLVFDNTNFMESTKFKIATYFQSVEDNPDVENAVTLLNPFYTIVPNSSIAQDADEMMLLLSNFVPSNPDASVKREIIVDAGALAGLRKRRQIEDMVIDAMENDRIEIHYQPIYDISTGLFSSAEALVRIRLKDGTLMYPDDFIPIVEESGRIIPLSDNIYKKVLSFIKLYRIEKLGVNRVALNLSVKQGERAVFVSRFLELLEKHSINPNLINLEITETSSLSSKENLLTNMKKLTEHGITFSLDDFGSGSSNLNYIIDMPISTVKLDRYLTDEYFKNSRAKAIVKTIIEMSHSLGIKIIAEGIETEVGLNEMKQLGVDFIQGYYFSKPVPEHEYLKFIQINNLK